MIQQEIFFTEDQMFRQWWLWLILLGIDGTILFWLYEQLTLKTQVSGKSVSNYALLTSAGVVVLVTALFFCIRLNTQIKRDGVYMKFFPFHWSYKYYSWDMIAKSYVRTYSPLGEYGGWGIRHSNSGEGMAYNISGNKGLQLELNNGKKILIGTNKPEELEAVLIKLNKSNF
ncbi:MAG: DUF6141 family protein [Candidatus Pedobacter colombiensis]|uniref:DUF6141 family protein n=1 Tax=Candidatus Pedobacter colombiensis TaxID=3121371 RepID=A0AAJ5W3T6_9SPHI|nr:DUF6141 family protein [Pedobacter sp.]WEK17544.1 MAG: DUF6141 family protein [Pedobacter sp.]